MGVMFKKQQSSYLPNGGTGFFYLIKKRLSIKLRIILKYINVKVNIKFNTGSK